VWLVRWDPFKKDNLKDTMLRLISQVSVRKVKT
jgi:hypothetical protein